MARARTFISSKLSLFLLATLVCIQPGDLQAQKIITKDKTLYSSSIDDLLTIKKVSVLPVVDNVNGIYSRPLEQHLQKEVERMHKWEVAGFTLVGPLVSPEELSEDPSKVVELASKSSADAFIATRVTKGPNGVTMNMSLFLTQDGKLLTKTELRNSQKFEISQLKEEMTSLLRKINQQIPYEGLVLSRSGNRVTVNIGRRDGVESGRVVSVIQIIKANRHPKFNFLINTEKEILGKVKLLKIDETLSFGKIVTEKEKGAIRKNAKISSLDFVKYTDYDSLGENSSTQDSLSSRPDGLISFGKNATAWLPKKTPTFGSVGAFVGNSLFNYNTTLSSGDSPTGKSFLNPYIGFTGELWLTPHWTMHATMAQGIFSIDNELSGSSPSELQATMSYYEFLIGYKIRLSRSIWGPNLELLGGFSNYEFKIDDSSPRAYSSTKYSGMKLGVRGSYPVDDAENYSLGANLFFILSPGLSESPSSSGGGEDNSASSFGLFGAMKLGVNVKATANLDLDLYKTTWGTATSASSSSQKHTKLNFGLHWLF